MKDLRLSRVQIKTIHQQLPPATSKAPFIRLPSVREEFEFRVLRQNRRVVKTDDDGDVSRKQEIELFHKVLHDISMGVPSDVVRRFLVRAYVKGMLGCGTAENCNLEGNTTIFTKRLRFRYRKVLLVAAASHESPNSCK